MSITCYDYLKKSIEVNGDFTAAISFGNKIKMSKIVSDIDAVAAYLNQIGVVKGDAVTVFLPTTVHAFVSFYALNKIGVIANIVHPLTSPDGLIESMNITKSKAVFILDNAFCSAPKSAICYIFIATSQACQITVLRLPTLKASPIT